MPDFGNPFAGNNLNRRLTVEEAIRAIRFSIAAEYEAVQLYEQIADAVPDPNIKALMKDIADEEIVHAGEFLHVLKRLNPKEEKLYSEGEQEAQGLMKTASSKVTGIIPKRPVKVSGSFQQLETLLKNMKISKKLKPMEIGEAISTVFKMTGKYKRPDIERALEEVMKGSKIVQALQKPSKEDIEELLSAITTIIDKDAENKVRSEAKWLVDTVKEMKSVKANTTDFITRLDLIADEIQHENPIIAMAIDRISDQLEKNHG